ncbi:Leukotriene B4 receptor 2 [Dissostichus eleginoides]|uniref:Leukotriene B4 receptor 2 n=1 Tax=Dissostichus eleginoides TaxID=100907 RepID=A0AAD9BTS4_DISEL|nr:Leukotriene B4 receptor 2 [Dissostichus eleginoides]
MEEFNSSLVTFNISSTPDHPSTASWVSIRLVPAVVLSICFLLGVPGNCCDHSQAKLAAPVQSEPESDAEFGHIRSDLPAPPASVDSHFCERLDSRPGGFGSTCDQRPAWDRLPLPVLFPIPAGGVMLTETLTGFVAISVVAFSYMGLHRKVNQAAFFNNPQTTRLVTSIIVTFFVLWMPYHITNVLSVAAISLKNERFLKFCMDSWYTVSALVFVISSLNPLLYAFASKNMCTVCQESTY